MPSKKRSVAKPPDFVFFVDRSLGIEPLRSVLTSAGVKVEIHDDHFKRDEEDPIWLAEVSRRSWVILTKDQRLRYRPLEISALRASRARVFVLVAGNLKGVEIAAIFRAAHRECIAFSCVTQVLSSLGSPEMPPLRSVNTRTFFKRLRTSSSPIHRRSPNIFSP